MSISSPAMDAARKLHDDLSVVYPVTFPPRFIVGAGQEEIFVYAPIKYPEIPEEYCGFKVVFNQSDCKAEAL